MNVINEIRAAIATRSRLRIKYEPGERVVEPHAVGLGSSGQVLLRAYQTDGASASGEPHDWKLFRADKIQRLETLPDHFPGPRPQYNPNDPAMKRGVIEHL